MNTIIDKKWTFYIKFFSLYFYPIFIIDIAVFLG